MRVFISWSKQRSHVVARELSDWIPLVLQNASPFFSEELDKGTLWSAAIVEALETSQYGIICVTPENRNEPWLNFEAGALANALKRRMSPLLVGLRKADISGPLAQYNLTETDYEDVRRLMSGLNEQLDTPLNEQRFGKAFDTYWPEMQKTFAEVAAMESDAITPPKRSVDDKLDEIIDYIRKQSRLVNDRDFALLSYFDPKRDPLDQMGIHRPDALKHLAEREFVIARDLAKGKTITEIAASFGVRPTRIRAIAYRTARSLGLTNLREVREYMNALAQQKAKEPIHLDEELFTELSAEM